MYSDWLELVTWLSTFNRNPLFQNVAFTLLCNFYVRMPPDPNLSSFQMNYVDNTLFFHQSHSIGESIRINLRRIQAAFTRTNPPFAFKYYSMFKIRERRDQGRILSVPLKDCFQKKPWERERAFWYSLIARLRKCFIHWCCCTWIVSSFSVEKKFFI